MKLFSCVYLCSARARAIAGSVLLCLAALVSSTTARANTPANTTVLVLGDSLSAAYGLTPEQGWVALLERKLKQSDARATVINASISGETTSGGRSRLPRLLERHSPSVVILALGANDGLRGLPTAAIEDNLRTMAQAARTAGARLVVLRMQLPPNYGAAYDREFRAAFSRVAEKFASMPAAFLLDGFAAQREFFQADGIHPTAAAQPRMLANVWPTLLKTLREREKP